jgi:hypothetical protein
MKAPAIVAELGALGQPRRLSRHEWMVALFRDFEAVADPAESF